MLNADSPMTADIARQLWSYDPETGELRWRVARPNGIKPGSLAGSPNGEGALLVGATIGGRRRLYLVHCVIWLMQTGAWPAALVDHRDGDRLNNRWKNLREATPTVNSQNRRRPRCTNKAGFLGVSLQRGHYVARIMVAKEEIRLGRFEDPETAHLVYLTAKRVLHEGCTI